MMGSGYKQGGPAGERSQRSVFVGNISYDVSEDTIRSIFSKAGNVLSIKMVHDRETGKPKGYGFIEFQDVGTAEMAIRNLNGYDLAGRVLRVDSAAGGMNMEEFNNQQQNAPAPVEENPYGSECDAGKAPERISQTVASLAPEKMFELMKQLQEAQKNNPGELNKLLVENPQLSYAVLQAAVVMRIVDPQTALGLLHRNKASTLQPFHQAPPPQVPMPPMSSMPPPQQQMPLPIPQNQPKPAFIHPGGPPMMPPMGGHQPVPSFAPQQYGQPVPPPQQYMPKHPVKPVQPEITKEEQQNAELLMQVMQLSEHDLQMLPAGDREKIIELRQQLKRNVK
uniref:RRM domain-containing protein n=1 Tax=Caenorhabditis japonica TaxID=281687 RepID=A0A8R1HY05_CAEJA